MGQLILFALALLIPAIYAHDVWATPVTACVDGPNGFGPYISWTLENDYFYPVTLTIRVATSLGPAGTQIKLQPYQTAGGSISGVLQPISASGTTTITGRAVWDTDGHTIDPWTKSTTLRQPAGCNQCTAATAGQLCGSQTNTAVCTANQCVGTQCQAVNVATDTRCPAKRGQADGLPLCTQQLCTNGACSATQPYADPACVASALPTGFIAACNVRACVGTQCITAPWYYPATAPSGAAPACTDLTGHDAQCWRPACVVDTTTNAPYGKGVCGGTAVDVNVAACTPPVAPNGQAVNPACYVPACTPGTGKCSTTFISGNPADHLGNCPVPTQYDDSCYWPYCDANGQCSGEVLTGTDAPNYVPAWRANMPCPANPAFDQQCYRPACVNGKCGGFPVTGNVSFPGVLPGQGSCPLPAGFDAACYMPGCVAGKCEGFPLTGTPGAPGMLPGETCPLPAGYDPACYIPGCVAGKCQGFAMDGTAAQPGMLPGQTCPLPAGFDAACYVPGCVAGKCQGFAMDGTAAQPGMLPGFTCPVPAGFDPQCYIPGCVAGKCQGFPVTGSTDAPGFVGTEPCTVDPTMNAQCWAPFCENGKCSGGAINLGLACTPSADEIVDGYSVECVTYICGSDATTSGHCVPSLLPMNSPCLDFGINPPDGCNEGVCIQGNCTASPTNIDQPCQGDNSAAAACNQYVCKLDDATGIGKCTPQAALIDQPCETDLDLCTTQACVLDPLTGLGDCAIVSTVDCSGFSANPCDPGMCDSKSGQCVSSPAPDFTPCENTADTTCSDYSCYHAQCVRQCLCGNGILDDGESCDWGADAWCPAPRPGEAATSDHCPHGLEPGNMGAGNGLGRNDSLSNCNQTACAVLRRASKSLSKGAIAGVAIAAAAAVAAIALAGALAFRAAGGGSGAGGSAAGGDMAAGTAVTNPLFHNQTNLHNPLFVDHL